MSQRRVLLALVVGCGGHPAPVAPPPLVQNVVEDGKLTTTVTREGDADHVVATGHQVDMAELPLAEWNPTTMPMSGRVDVEIDVRVPVGEGVRLASQATGVIDLRCAPCTLGAPDYEWVPDLKSSRTGAFAGSGIHLGFVTLSSLHVRVEVGNGHARVTTWEVVSDELALDVTGDVTLGDRPGAARVEACVRYRPLPALEKRDALAAAALLVTGAPTGADGKLQLRVIGPASAPRFYGMICDGSQPLREVPDEPPNREVYVPAPPPPHAGSATADEIAGIREIDPLTHEVDLALVRKWIADPDTFAKGARIVPWMKQGQPAGFKLYAIHSDSAIALLGLSNGDAIVTIDGTPVVGRDIENVFYGNTWRPGSVIKVDIERRGTAHVLTYRIVGKP